MPKIDPTARVSLHAEFSDDVRIGPWCIVGRGVKLGSGCVLDSGVVIQGPTEIGARNRFHHGAVIGTDPQDLKYRGARSLVRIGEGEETSIGSANLVMAYAHVAHNCRIGDHAVIAGSVALAGHVEVQDYAIVGGLSPVHQFVKIGAHSIIGGGCRVPKDVVPFVRAAGNPLHVAGLNSIGLERRGFSEEARAELRKVYRIFFRTNYLVQEALAVIRRDCLPLPEVEQFCHFVERSERGITR